VSHSIAIVGSGPSGFYATEAILKARPDARVDLFDRLPTPYGLVRIGVAPDHQGTKNVWRVFQRTAKRPEVRFLGDVELGRDLSLAELRERYDAVVLAIGAPVDRDLDVPGEDLRGVLGSGPFTCWYNGHPDFSSLAPELEELTRESGAIAVIGNGNVAVDVVRVLGRVASEMTKTDLPAYASERIGRARITDIYMIGRRGPGEASFTPVELRELGELAETVAVVDAKDLPETLTAKDPKDQKLKEKILDILRGYSQNDPKSKRARLHFVFYAAPSEILGENGRVTKLVLDKTRVENGKAVMTGEQVTLDVGIVIKAIGYHVKPLDGVHVTKKETCYPNVDGRMDAGLWAVGWAKRGPSGVIATNRQDSINVVERLLKELPAEAKPDPRPSIDALLEGRGKRPVFFTDWEKIEQVEHERAVDGAPRVKVTSWEELRKLAFGR
jgi:NADPH-dependent glutamate synthase beta subunit-like oxidoreductase